MAVDLTPTTRELAEQRFLESYGLPLDVAYKLLKATVHEDARDLHADYANAPCIRIPYFHPVTRQPLVTWPAHAPFERLRYLTEFPRAKDFSEKRSELPRYVQRAGTVNGLYFPPNYQTWQLALDNFHQPLFITEGEFKAARACYGGYPTVAVGGVEMWRGRKRLGYDELLPEFDWFNLVGREVYIVWDSDWADNENVARNLNNLGQALRQRGAFPHALLIPPSGDDKIGLDDLLNKSDGDGIFKELMEAAPPLRAVAPLFRVNEEAAYVLNPGLVAFESGEKATADSLTHRWTDPLVDRVVRDGRVLLQPAKLGPTWLAWPLRRTVARITYAPGQAQRTIADPRTGEPLWNEWRGWGCEPKKGDVKPFLQLLEHLTGALTAEQRLWLLRWFAYPLQHPGAKLRSSVVVHSIVEGNGKSLLGASFQPIYGDNYGLIRQTDVDQRFTAWAVRKQFVQGDEVSSTREKRNEINFFKNLITQTELTIDQKYMPSYSVPDVINYYWTSNHSDPLFLSDKDRRFFIVKVEAAPLSPTFYQSYVKWLAGPGAPALFYHLLHLDLGDFNPSGAAPATAAKAEMIEHSHSDLARWVRQLLDDPDHVLKLGEHVRRRDLWLAEELIEQYRLDHPDRKAGPNAMGRALAEAGVPIALNQQLRGTPAGGRHRFYVIRNRDKWTKPNLTVETVIMYLKKNWEK